MIQAFTKATHILMKWKCCRCSPIQWKLTKTCLRIVYIRMMRVRALYDEFNTKSHRHTHLRLYSMKFMLMTISYCWWVEITKLDRSDLRDLVQALIIFHSSDNHDTESKRPSCRKEMRVSNLKNARMRKKWAHAHLSHWICRIDIERRVWSGSRWKRQSKCAIY